MKTTSISTFAYLVATLFASQGALAESSPEQPAGVARRRVRQSQGLRGSIATFGGAVQEENGRDLAAAAVPETRQHQLQELAAAEATWKAKNVLNYHYTYNQLGSNNYKVAYPWAVTVQNGHEASATDGNGNLIGPDYVVQPQTMELLFQRIRNAYSDNIPQVVVRYNEAYGYPLDIYIVYNDSTADATYDAQITDLGFN